MRFERAPRRLSSHVQAESTCFLVDNSWDDFGFKTAFEAVLFDDNGKRYDLGYVRILRADMDAGRVVLPEEISSLNEYYCSLGSSREYYEKLHSFPVSLRTQYLKSLNDVVHNRQLFFKFESQPGMQKSLLREVSRRDVLEAFPRALAGLAELTPYAFSFEFKDDDRSEKQLRFKVSKDSTPPSNVHVLIGRNGVGKTRLLAGIADALVDNYQPTIGFTGSLKFGSGFVEAASEFLNVVVVAYSAFDRFDPIAGLEDRTESSVPYYYLGMKKVRNSTDLNGVALKTAFDFQEEFENSIRVVLGDPNKLDRWRGVVATLESDPIIREMKLGDVVGEDDQELTTALVSLFAPLSSGHKVVLLTATRLVELISDRSLVLIDEPETHLHPPLLSSFVRALSDLLLARNAVAIIATHSPVVLQEVPGSCVQVVERVGTATQILPPRIETFGENVGTLTRRIFGLEIEESGFYRMILEETAGQTLDQSLATFGGHVGTEGRALIRALRGLSRDRDATSS